MIPNGKNKKKLRVPLSEVSKIKLSGWRRQLAQRFPGIKISDAELSNWAIEVIGDTLSKKQEGQLKNQFFDEVKHLEWMLEKARAAKRTGSKPPGFSQNSSKPTKKPKKESDPCHLSHPPSTPLKISPTT